MGVRDRIGKATGQPAPDPFRRPSGRASYPRRVTLDLDDHRYRVLREIAYEGRVPAAAILRAALDALVTKTDELAAVVSAAQAEHPGPGDG